MYIKRSSGLSEIANSLLVLQFLFACFLFFRGVICSLWDGNSVFASIFLGGFLAHFIWLAYAPFMVRSTLFSYTAIGDGLKILLTPLMLVIMLDFGWDSSARATSGQKLDSEKFALVAVAEMQDNLRRANNGEVEYVKVVRHYESMNDEPYQMYINRTIEGIQEQRKLRTQREASEPWSVRFINKLFE